MDCPELVGLCRASVREVSDWSVGPCWGSSPSAATKKEETQLSDLMRVAFFCFAPTAVRYTLGTHFFLKMAAPTFSTALANLYSLTLPYPFVFAIFHPNKI
jgi:hypothetical protein